VLNLDNRHPDPPSIDGVIPRFDAVMVSIAVHLLLMLLVLWVSTLSWLQPQAQAAAIEPVRVEPRSRMQPFILVEPRVDLEALRAPLNAPLSDKDRVAQTRERPPTPTKIQPFSRGNTPEYIESQPSARARGQGPTPEPSVSSQGSNGTERQGREASATPPVPPSAEPQFRNESAGSGGRTSPPGGSLGEVLRNLNKYVQNQQFENPQGGASDFGSTIQFDTKGVEFGPWLRRFVAQVKRNWFVPYAAMSLKGNVVLTFNVHKNGAITDLTVVRPSTIGAFTNAAFNALAASNPTQPLPPEYPADRAFFTVTFYYNESPP
jgi:TonB family protein